VTEVAVAAQGLALQCFPGYDGASSSSAVCRLCLKLFLLPLPHPCRQAIYPEGGRH
jgi:hypothetical protein